MLLAFSARLLTPADREPARRWPIKSQRCINHVYGNMFPALAAAMRTGNEQVSRPAYRRCASGHVVVSSTVSSSGLYCDCKRRQRWRATRSGSKSFWARKAESGVNDILVVDVARTVTVGSRGRHGKQNSPPSHPTLPPHGSSTLRFRLFFCLPRSGKSCHSFATNRWATARHPPVPQAVTVRPSPRWRLAGG